jgi:hypothetical protein
MGPNAPNSKDLWVAMAEEARRVKKNKGKFEIFD